MATAIIELIQQLDPGDLVELFELDLSPIVGTATSEYFHAGTNKLNNPVVWQGKTYQPWPVTADGFDLTVQGKLPRPSIKVANVDASISVLVMDYDDLVGAKVIRRRTFARYLDAVNFPGGVNANADPNQYLPDDVYYVERKVEENKVYIEFELASVLDLEGEQLPSRSIVVGYCPSGYRRWNTQTNVFDYTNTSECGYTGNAYFTSNNQPTTDAAQDVCSKSVAGCKLRFGAAAALPFGGFPAARTYKY